MLEAIVEFESFLDLFQTYPSDEWSGIEVKNNKLFLDYMPVQTFRSQDGMVIVKTDSLYNILKRFACCRGLPVWKLYQKNRRLYFERKMDNNEQKLHWMTGSIKTYFIEGEIA